MNNNSEKNPDQRDNLRSGQKSSDNVPLKTMLAEQFRLSLKAIGEAVKVLAGRNRCR
jgi:hypothetical protein